MIDWKSVTLDKIAQITTGKTNSIDAVANGIYPLFDRSQIIKKSNKYLFDEEAIIVPGEGQDFIPRYFKGKFDLHQRAYAVIPNDKEVNGKYLYYAILYGNDHFSRIAVGSTVKSLRLNSFQTFSLKLPSLEVQKSISDTLSCLDDKIELNNSINKTLEEMAQAIFKSWFIDFEPFQDGEFEDSELGRIPKGWRVESLDNIAEFLNGLAMQKYRPETDEFFPVIKIKELNQGFSDDNSDKASASIPKQYIINDGDVIFSWSGTLMVKIWTGGRGGLNQHLFKVTSGNYDKWFYYLWTLKHLEKFKAIAQDKATTMGHIKRSHLTESKMIIPKDSDMKVLKDILNPVFDGMIDVCIQTKTLNTIRDSLLPKLMSGEIRVPLEEVQ